MNEWDAFDQDLMDSMSALPPPEDAIRDVTPWRQAIERVVLGLCLTSFTLNFLYLQYLLPTIGTLQLYLGFRVLRRNNRWFQVAFYISICKVIMLFINLALAATPLDSFLFTPRVVLQTALTFSLFAVFRQALRRAAADMDRTMAHDPLAWAMAWYGLIVALALFWPKPGWLVFAAFVYAFCRIIKSLGRVAAELEGWGYAVQASPVRLDAGRFLRLSLGALAALVVALSLASNHLPMDGTAIEQNFDIPETTAIRAELAGLGFPEELLAQLPDSEVTGYLSQADRCLVNEDARGSSTDNGVSYQDIQVLIGPRTVRCYHFFTVDTRRAVWQNQITLSPGEGGTVSDPAASIAWTRKNVRSSASLDMEADSYLSFFGDRHHTFSALFSYPFLSADRGGWAAYTITYPPGVNGSSSTLSYATERWRDFYPFAPLPDQASALRSHSYSSYSVRDFSSP